MVPGWFFMDPGWFSWFSMVLWFVFHGAGLVFHSARLVFMVFHGSRSVFMVFHGSRLVFHGSKSVFMFFSWFQVGSSWFFMVFLQNVPARTVSWPDDPI